MDKSSFKITSRFYVIYGDYEPIYVGYTNRTVRQRFMEHKRDKDFSDYENVEVKELVDEKLSFDFTWDYKQTCENADKVSEREAKLVNQYGTQGSVYQLADGGGLTWNYEKWFVKSNKDNPKYRNLSNIEVINKIIIDKVIAGWVFNFVEGIHEKKITWITNFVNHSNPTKECWLVDFVRDLEKPNELWIHNFVSSMKTNRKTISKSPLNGTTGLEKVWINSFVLNIKTRKEGWLSIFVGEVNPERDNWLSHFISGIAPSREIWMRNMIGNITTRQEMWVRNFVTHMIIKKKMWLEIFVTSMKDANME